MSVKFNPNFSIHTQYDAQKASSFEGMVDQLERKYRYKMATLSPEKAGMFAAVLDMHIAAIKNHASDLPLDEKLQEILSGMLQSADLELQNYFEQIEGLEAKADNFEVRYEDLAKQIATASMVSAGAIAGGKVSEIFIKPIPKEKIPAQLMKTREAFQHMIGARRDVNRSFMKDERLENLLINARATGDEQAIQQAQSNCDAMTDTLGENQKNLQKLRVRFYRSVRELKTLTSQQVLNSTVKAGARWAGGVIVGGASLILSAEPVE